MPTRPEKPCTICGRRIQWRKKWERDWPNIKYCSDRCRRAGSTPTDRQLETAILALLAAQPRNTSICPSQAARAVDPTNWRTLLEPARAAARRLVAANQLIITQSGRPVDPSTARGPIRLQLPR
jgi:hypothetical protein